MESVSTYLVENWYSSSADMVNRNVQFSCTSTSLLCSKLGRSTPTDASFFFLFILITGSELALEGETAE